MDLAVVGLGNVGVEYAFTRHNVGFMFADFVAKREKLRFFEHKTVYLAKGNSYYIIKPKLYMNNSGKALLSSPIPISKMKILVVYDDADLEFGDVRFKARINSYPSHRGLRDIYESLKRDDIMRIRIGISKPPEGMSLSEWVLSELSEEERKQLNIIFEKAYKILKELVWYGNTNP